MTDYEEKRNMFFNDERVQDNILTRVYKIYNGGSEKIRNSVNNFKNEYYYYFNYGGSTSINSIAKDLLKNVNKVNQSSGYIEENPFSNFDGDNYYNFQEFIKSEDDDRRRINQNLNKLTNDLFKQKNIEHFFKYNNYKKRVKKYDNYLRVTKDERLLNWADER
jgi:hypothetical protein